ncbi:hypothetical protein BKA81DRAFT_195152 [Phyllosticta paracitricarpa]
MVIVRHDFPAQHSCAPHNDTFVKMIDKAVAPPKSTGGGGAVSRDTPTDLPAMSVELALHAVSPELKHGQVNPTAPTLLVFSFCPTSVVLCSRANLSVQAVVIKVARSACGPKFDVTMALLCCHVLPTSRGRHPLGVDLEIISTALHTHAIRGILGSLC